MSDLSKKIGVLRDILLTEAHAKKDEPKTYYEGVLDMYNETLKVIDEMESVRTVQRKRTRKSKKNPKDI